MEGRTPPGRPKKTWRKVVGEDMRMLNITEENSIGNKWTLNNNDDDDDDDDIPTLLRYSYKYFHNVS